MKGRHLAVGIVAGIVATVWTGVLRADTLLNIPVHYPEITGITLQDLNYVYDSGTGIGTLSVLSITPSPAGNPKARLTLADGSWANYYTKLELTAKLRVNASTGAIIGTAPGSFINVWQDLDKNLSTETLQFQSTNLLKFGSGLQANGTAGMYECLWQTGPGTSLPIQSSTFGSMIRMNMTYNGGVPADPNYLTSFSILASTQSKADVFADLPKALLGGLALLSGVVGANVLRRHLRLC